MGGSEFVLHHHWRPEPKPRRPKSILIPDPLTPNGDNNGGYTSLTDLIIFTPSAAVNSPPASFAETRIRNSLVKHAAYAYLQATPSSTPSSCRRRRRRRSLASLRWSFAAIGSCFGFLGRFLRRMRIREERGLTAALEDS